MDETIHGGYQLKKMGRPRKLFSVEDYEEAQKKYRHTWYQKNKTYVKEHRDLMKERERRKLRVKSGYFAIYSGDDMYIGFSKDINSRARDIIKNIENKSKNTAFYDKFDFNKTYDWKILGFCDEANMELHDKLYNTELESNVNLNPI